MAATKAYPSSIVATRDKETTYEGTHGRLGNSRLGLAGTLPPRPPGVGLRQHLEPYVPSALDVELFAKPVGGHDATINRAAEVTLRRAVHRCASRKILRLQFCAIGD